VRLDAAVARLQGDDVAHALPTCHAPRAPLGGDQGPGMVGMMVQDPFKKGCFWWIMGSEWGTLGQGCHSGPFSNAVIFGADVNFSPNQTSRQSSDFTLFGNKLATP
jgi:hypothetical protein